MSNFLFSYTHKVYTVLYSNYFKTLRDFTFHLILNHIVNWNLLDEKMNNYFYDNIIHQYLYKIYNKNFLINLSFSCFSNFFITYSVYLHCINIVREL